MRRVLSVFVTILAFLTAAAQTEPVRFAYLSDIHITLNGTSHIENLKR